MQDTSIKWFKWITFIEGLSLIALFLIAMPLKYLAGDPTYVRYVGMTHGVLFIIFMGLLTMASEKNNFTGKFTAWIVFLSLIPFGSFYINKKLTALYPVDKS